MPNVYPIVPTDILILSVYAWKYKYKKYVIYFENKESNIMFKHIVILKHDAWNILFKLRSICTCHCFHTGFLQELKPLILLPGYFWQRHKRFHHFIFSFYSHCFTYLHQIFVTSPCHVTLCEKRNKHRQRNKYKHTFKQQKHDWMYRNWYLPLDLLLQQPLSHSGSLYQETEWHVTK